MTFFKKQPQQQRPLADRLSDFRGAIFDAMKKFDVPSSAAISVWQAMALEAKMAHAVTAPLPGATPRLYRANLPESKRDLAKWIAQSGEAA